MSNASESEHSGRNEAEGGSRCCPPDTQTEPITCGPRESGRGHALIRPAGAGRLAVDEESVRGGSAACELAESGVGSARFGQEVAQGRVDEPEARFGVEQELIPGVRIYQTGQTSYH